ncbi:hypothetical protein AURDEDRAFT_181932 [Auricularia subglabra TFB-10046 SS5]|nr:hypothetical protein AURDEDRAFT_181932 [Auricularia subglabra TFB-10046 SS5]
MSRGGGRGGGFRGRGRGGFGGRSGPGADLLALGLTPADLAALSKEQAALYPTRDSLPILATVTDSEREIARLQVEYGERMRRSAYYIVETHKSTELPRYSDKYRTEAHRPSLRREDLNADFFPPEVFESYFNPKKRKRKGTHTLAQKVSAAKKKKLNLDDLKDGDDDDAEKGSDAESGVGSQEEQEDYDEDDDDNDYADNYFDNGEGEDGDDLGGAGGDEGEATYD